MKDLGNFDSLASERWKTISKRDPEFLAYLQGTFSNSHRALPVRSLNVDTVSELVTFEIVPKVEIALPTISKIFWQLMRPRTLVLSLGPMFVTVFIVLAHGYRMNFEIALSSFFGVLFFHIAANLFNDYGDHMKGRDRLRGESGSRVIQKGWLPAYQVNQAAWGLMFVAGICGLPAVYLHFTPILIFVGLVGLVGLEFAFQRLRLKARGWSELVAFALTGPLLTSGFSWAMSGRVYGEEIVLGCVFGLLSLLYFHSVNFENIMIDSQAGVRTWATRVGFDASQKFFYFIAAAQFLSMAIYVLVFEPRVQMLLVLGFLAAHLWILIRRVWRLASPLSSDLSGLRWAVVSHSWFLTALLIVALATDLGNVVKTMAFWNTP